MNYNLNYYYILKIKLLIINHLTKFHKYMKNNSNYSSSNTKLEVESKEVRPVTVRGAI